MYALTAKGMKYMDQFASQAGLPGVVLMENAARGVADEVAARIPDKSAKILVLAGHGNNGGDAVAAARLLKCKGYLSYETLADNIGIGATADEIDAMKVLRDNGRGIHFELAKLDSDELAYEIKICEGSRNDS